MTCFELNERWDMKADGLMAEAFERALAHSCMHETEDAWPATGIEGQYAGRSGVALLLEGMLGRKAAERLLMRQGPGGQGTVLPQLNPDPGQPLMAAVYDAFRRAGFGDQAARAMVAEVGRENSFRADLMFGSHRDPHNRAGNVGLLSFQGPRATNLSNFLRERGLLDRHGNIERSQRALDAQAQFIKQEMQTSYRPTWNVLNNPDASYRDMARVLGANYIRWRHNDPRYAHHHLQRDNYYNQITGLVNNGRQATLSAGEAPDVLVHSNLDNARVRRGEVNPRLQNILNEAAAYAGVDQIVIVSGGQRMPGAPGHTGSHRHDDGNAADIDLYANGKRLAPSNEQDRAIMERFIERAVALGATGIGGPSSGYMGPGRIHVGFSRPQGGSGSETTWNAPSWVRQAHARGLARRVSLEEA
jgi:Phage tail lysozyme